MRLPRVQSEFQKCRPLPNMAPRRKHAHVGAHTHTDDNKQSDEPAEETQPMPRPQTCNSSELLPHAPHFAHGDSRVCECVLRACAPVRVRAGIP
eukprot:7708335-Alexandrium_andersonii.AAC.1